MNFVQTTHIYGVTPLALKYNDEELNKLIGEFIKEDKEFSYSQLCNNILYKADHDDMLDKKPNTSYSQIALSHNDIVRICKLLWERIWAKEVMILFNNTQDAFRRNEETYFIAIR